MTLFLIPYSLNPAFAEEAKVDYDLVSYSIFVKSCLINKVAHSVIFHMEIGMKARADRKPELDKLISI